MFKKIIFASALAVFAFAQDASAQSKPIRKPRSKPRSKAETTTLGDISALAALKSSSGQTTCEIASLVIYLERADVDPIEISINGNDDKKFAKTMKSAKKGDRFTFTQIKSKCSDATEQKLSDVVIEVE